MTTYEEALTTEQDYSQYPSAMQTNGLSEQPPPAAEGEDNSQSEAASVPPPPQQSEWDQAQELVNANPDDFGAWEYLIRVAESVDGGITAQSSEENIKNVRNVYDRFLAKFPLCFGYWRKYADIELAIDSAAGAEKIYERGVAAISNSVDLWTQYCQFKIEHAESDEEIRGLFERGAACVGLDFLAHIFWDKYIEFEESRDAHDRVLSLLERIIRIPLHQYAKFFDKYSQLSQTRPLTELTEEQIQQDIRMRIYNMNVEIYMKTQAETNKRWPFEHEIKRPYFHVKPMDELQLTNWRRYLDFEESEGDDTRIQVLHERCLVACALYDEFWLRYARWMLSKNRIQEARNIFSRAITVFIPVNRPSIRLSFALFEEEQNRIEAAREIYKELTENLPGCAEVIYKNANFERRQNPGDSSIALDILKQSLEGDILSDERSAAFISVQYANMLWRSKQSVEEARTIYQEGTTKFLGSKYFWLNYLNFELAQNDDPAEQRITEVFEKIRSDSTISPESIRDISQRYLDFLTERSQSISAISKVEMDLNSPIALRAAQDGKKRVAEDEDIDRPMKMMRGQWPYPATGAAAQVGFEGYPYAYPYAQPPTTPTAPTAAATGAWDYTQPSATGYQ
ncbi:6594_t:CDS:10 [Paraglomus brasilianum]|uniref:6594_t:CDS:1 n=1 Tax=Paraglomus brasilianum TaxID=144538 RepID=A0A9N9FCR3_9GLOM|nr:6594_t:CDS:10 [Paraglomus brasilianum]